VALDLGRFDKPDPRAEKLWKVKQLVIEAKVLCQNGKLGESIDKLNDAIEIEPNYAPIYYWRAMSYKDHQMSLYRQSESPEIQRRDLTWGTADIKHYVQLAPSDFWGMNLFMTITTCSASGFDIHGSVLPGQPISPLVTQLATKLIESENLPNDQLAEAYMHRASARTRFGPGDRGVLSDLSEAIRLSPQDAQPYRMRAEFTQRVDPAGSAADLRKAQELGRAYQARVANDYAWWLATAKEARERDGPKAYEWANRACQLTNYGNWGYIDTLAAAYAEAGDFKAAVEWENKALELAPNAEKDKCQQRLDMYMQRKPFRQ
jgi:tetratricopeptide (TPR) repeat protein